MSKIALEETDTETLVELCKQRDRKAQLALYKQYSRGMYYVALRFFNDPHDAEEAMQEGFISAFMKIDQFSGGVTFGAWVKRIVINKSIDMLKARKLNTVALNETMMTTQDDYDNWDIEDSSIIAEDIKYAIDQLPEKYRYPIHLFLIEGYDHQEVSEILGITPVSSRTLVHRAKKQLKKELVHLKHGTGY